jgi:hypothetical protein
MALGIPPEILEWLENGEAAKLCSCGEKQVLRFFYRDVIGEYRMSGNGSWMPDTSNLATIEVECACCMTGGAVVTTRTLDRRVWVVVTNSGGLVNDDVWAYTSEEGAKQRQDDEDAKYGIKRAEDGEIIECQGDEGDYIVATYEVKLDEPPEQSWMNVEGMGPTSDIMAPMTSEDEEPETVTLDKADLQDLLDFIAEAEDKGVDLKEVERVRAILGYPIP